MHHIIIGLAGHGFECLTQLNRLCNDRLGEQQKPLFFHIDFSEKSIDGQGFVDTISIPVKLRQDGLHATVGLIEKTLGVAQVEKVKMEIPVSRRVYAESFKKHGKLLWDKINRYINDENVFHIITDVSAYDATGVLFDILSELSSRSANVNINVYSFLPIGSISEKNSAQTYATLLEYREFNRDKTSFLMYPYEGKKFEKEALLTCAYQILNTVNVKVDGGLPNNKVPDQNIFARVKEIAVSVDTHKMYVSMSRQNAMRITEKLFFADSDEKFGLPEYFRYLFDDKKWRLYDAFLHKEEDPNNPIASSMESIEEEWNDRAKFCLKRIQEGHEHNWRNQVKEAYKFMNEIYMRHFRGKGVGIFYSVNENMIDNLAEQIVANLETTLIYEWQGTYSSLSTLKIWIDEITAKIQQRLEIYEEERQEYEEQAKSFKQNYQDIIDEYDRATSNTRTQKIIQKEHNLQNIISLLERRHIADCNMKSKNFGCKVLEYSVKKLNKLQERLDKCIDDARNTFSGYLNSSPKLLVQKIIATYGEIEMKAAVDTNLQSLMPKNFLDMEIPLYQDMRENVIKKIDSSRGLEAVLNAFDASVITNEISHILILRHPFFLNKTDELETTFFWKTVPNLLASGKDEFKTILDKWQEHHDEEKIYYSYWIIPPCTFEQNVLDSTVEACKNLVPVAQIISNSEMTPYSIRYQEISHLSLEKINGVESLRQAYHQAVLSENGAVLSLLMHTQNETPFPEYEVFQKSSEPDKVRENLLLCELYGMITERDNSGKNEIVLSANNTEVVLGDSFPSIVENITLLKSYLLTHALSSAEIQRVMDEDTIAATFSTRLEKIKNQCLNGKKDLKEASWQEAGSFMPWARKVDSLLRKLK